MTETRVVYLEPGKISIEKVPLPELKPTQVMIECHQASICGSERYFYQGITVNPEDEATPNRASVDAGPPPVTANTRAFRVLVRNALFRRVELAALRRWNDLGDLDADSGWDAQRWQAALEDYYAEHTDLGTGPGARGPRLLQIEEQPGLWRVRQVFDDPAGDHDWGISAEVDLAASDAEGSAVVRVQPVDCY